MRDLFRAAAVIARRDYVATVWSRTFLLFLIGPLLPLVFGGLVGALASGDESAPSVRAVSLAVSAPDAALLAAARMRLTRRLGPHALPELRRGGDPQLPLLSGTLDRPRLAAPAGELRRLTDELGLILDTARAARGVVTPSPVAIATVARPAPSPPADRTDLARGAQFVLFFLSVLLTGMLISNLVEEKSNKVIELLASAVPIDALFLGKLVAMLGVSLTGVTVWLGAGTIGALVLLPPALMPAPPTTGWPVFLGLGLVYFVSLFLLIGAVYLGVGAQAGSVREVQTLSMPLTMAQLVVFALASASVAHPDRPLGLAAAAVPWSSPLAMLARAAVDPALWPHALAIGWQLVALAVSIRVGAALFRTNILRSGRPGRR